jgi:hypothetical protein
LLRHWSRIDGDPEGYLRRTLYNMAADGWRRRGAWLRKLPLIHPGGNGAPSTDAVDTVDLRDALGRALAQWARPTSANLGSLRVTVPDGFRHTHTGGLPVPGIGL